MLQNTEMGYQSSGKSHFEFLKKRPSKYVISLVIVILATMAQLWLRNFTIPPPFLLYYPSVIMASLYGDGISGIILSLVAIDYFFIGEGRFFDITDTGDIILVSVFVIFSLIIRFLTRSLNLARLRAENLVQVLETEKNLREQFVASLTHDLRNPISAANVSAKLYLKHPDKADLPKIINRIISATDRADTMIRDLLDANAIKAGEKIILPMSHCDLLDIASDVVEEKHLKLGKSDTLVLEAKSPVKGIWNADALRRIFENLIDNALKYGDPGKPVTVNLFKDANQAELLVHNFGNPLSEDDKNKIFEAFGRAHFAKVSGKQGWGLGLTLVRGLAEAHKGAVSVESNDSGTTFTVVMPLDAREK